MGFNWTALENYASYAFLLTDQPLSVSFNHTILVRALCRYMLTLAALAYVGYSIVCGIIESLRDHRIANSAGTLDAVLQLLHSSPLS